MRQTLFDQMRERLLARAGCPEMPPPQALPSYDELRRTQWSDEFERLWRGSTTTPISEEFLQLMRNRLIMGALRYGLLGRPNKPAYDNVGSIRRRLKKHAADGNLEHMVDVANIALVEFVDCRHPRKHYAALNRHASWTMMCCLREYELTANLSTLILIARFAHDEFLHGTHPLRHFATGDGDLHTQLA